MDLPTCVFMLCKFSYDKLGGKSGPLEPSAPLSLVCPPDFCGGGDWLGGPLAGSGATGARCTG